MGSISFDQAIQIGSILASGLIVSYQIKSAKKSEIDFKIHQQHKEQYSKLTALLKKALISAKKKEDHNIDQDEWLDVQMGMSMYASEKTLKAYINLLKSSQANRDPIMINRQIGDLILLMRKEVGLQDSNLTSREVLSTFITDINDSKYDNYFK